MSCDPFRPTAPEPRCKPLCPTTEVLAKTPCPELNFCAGNYTLSFKDGCLIKTQRINPVPDGWYTRVRVEDGCVVEAGQAPPPAVLLPDVCDSLADATCKELEAAPDVCNLTTILSGTQMLTLANAESADPEVLQVTGCGTSAAPFHFSINYEALRAKLLGPQVASGARCALVVDRGVVTGLPNNIIQGIVNKSPNLLGASIDADCNLVLEIVGVGGTDGTKAEFTAQVVCPNGTGAYIEFGAFKTPGNVYVVNKVSDNAGSAANAPSGWTPAAAQFYNTLDEAKDYMSRIAVTGCEGPSA